MRLALAVVLGAVLLVAALLATAPATLLDARIAALSGGRVRVADAAGTIWSGSGELVLLPARTRQPMRWRLEPWPLLRGEVRAAIGTDTAGAPSATLAFARDHFELRALDLALPVETILPLATSAKVALGGKIYLQVAHLAWLGQALDGQLSVQWRDASVPGPRADAPIALGDVRIDLSGRGAELSGPVRNSGGDVEMSGQLVLAAAGAASLELTLRPRPGDRERAEAIAAALSTLAPDDGRGGYRLRWTGAWR
jgi:general secretion pathway protein N